MIMFLLAAAAASAQPAVSSDPDVHCMAAYLMVAGGSKDDTGTVTEEKAGIQSIVMYFMGKLDARKPGADLQKEILGLVASPGYGAIVGADIDRCSAEAEARGKYLQTWGNSAEPAGPKP